MSTSIFVMTHKKAVAPADPCYRLLQVGRASHEDLGYLGDDSGDHISAENCHWGELTGYYWLWKNYPGQEAIGVCHYRRFFGDAAGAYTGARYDGILAEYDLITSELVKGEKSCREAYAEAHHIEDLEAVERAMKRVAPDYYEAYEKVLDGRDNYYGNLSVMPRALFDEYCSWMFSVLMEASEEIDVSGYDAYHARVFGFLSETFLMTFVRQNGLRPYESPILFTGEKTETVELKARVAGLLREKKLEEAITCFSQALRERPDLELPASDLRHEIPMIGSILVILREEMKAGFSGFAAISWEQEELIAHYRRLREVLDRLGRNMQTEEDLTYLNTCHLSGIALEVILQNDLYRVLQCEPLQADVIRCKLYGAD